MFYRGRCWWLSMAKAKANITAVFGATGSGKSLFVKSQIAGVRRLIVFDSMGEYIAEGLTVIRSARALLEAVKAKEFRVAFVPAAADKARADQFAFVCDLAFRAKNLMLVVEELRFLTKPSWAPMEWARINSQGRHANLSVIGTSQRPASVDKDFVGNCTRVRSGRLAYDDDARAVAKVLRIPEGELLELPPLAYIERELTTGNVSRGVIALPKSR
jgi:DNA helicase HerA-like ATPase